MSNFDSNLVDISVTLHAETDKAWRVSDDGENDNAVWIPKSQAELEHKKGVLYELTLPEWLAIDKGLV